MYDDVTYVYGRTHTVIGESMEENEVYDDVTYVYV